MKHLIQLVIFLKSIALALIYGVAIYLLGDSALELTVGNEDSYSLYYKILIGFSISMILPFVIWPLLKHKVNKSERKS